MSPRTGRPPKENTKDINIGFRFSRETADKLKNCAEKLGVTRTQVVEKGIDLVEAEIKK